MNITANEYLVGPHIPKYSQGKAPSLATILIFLPTLLLGGWKAELRTNAGADHQSRTSFDTASNGTGSYAALNYIALTENSSAPAAGDTSLTGELNVASGGLNRAQAAYSHTNGTNTVVLTKTFTINTNDGSPKTPAKAGLFNATSGGTLGYSTLIPNPPPLVFANAVGDSMATTWTFTL